MKRFFCAATLGLGLSLVTTMELRGELLAWWPFDSVEAEPGRDTSPGSRSPMVFLKENVELVEGRDPGSLAWNTGGVDFASHPAFPATSSFTFSTWARRESSRDGQLETVARLGERNSAGWAIYVGDNGNWFVYTYGEQTRRLDSRVAADTKVWTHLAVTFAATGAPNAGGDFTGRLLFYVNGRLVNQGEFGIGTSGTSTAPLVLGARFARGVVSWPFDGQISHAAVWDEALPPSVVAELARGVNPGNVSGAR